MTKMKNKLVLFAAASILLAGCGFFQGRQSGSEVTGNAGFYNAEAGEPPAELRSFPEITVPSVYDSETEEAKEYVLQHYWDGFFKGDGATTPKAVLGVADEDLEQALANYIQILHLQKLQSTPDSLEPFKQACRSVKHMFSQLETRQLADTSSKAYQRFTEIVSRYLYDPNSPLRDEDFYLPFVEGMAASPCTSDNMRKAYSYEATQCRKNGYGQTAPNFGFKDKNGNRSTLHGVHADYTMLFFSNPGCNSCKEIIDDINGCGCIRPMLADHRLAIVNIYIDEEVQKWREYLPNYPKEWINGYDYTFSLRENGGYDVRAIPSLYLLDSKKRVLMKDAPTSSVLTYLENIYNQ